MVIGVDFDEVLTDLANFFYNEGEKYAKDNNIKINKNESAYSTLEYFGWSQDDDVNFWELNHLKYTKLVNAKPYAKEALEQLKTAGNKIIIITARYDCDSDTEKGREKRRISEEWLKKHGIQYDEIYYVGRLSKVQMILDKKIDIFIDDAVKNLDEISRVIPTICFDEKYNRNYNNDNMKRLGSWKEIFDYINTLSLEVNCEND